VDDDTMLDETFEHAEQVPTSPTSGSNSPVVTIEVPAASSPEAQQAQSTNRIRLFLICLSVVCLWLLLPITWVVIEPPMMSQRVCQGSLQGTYHVVYVAFNILLIIATAILAYVNNELDSVVHPIFIMLFTNALFQPMDFIIKSQQFPNRSAVALTLQPAVGILMGTLLEVGLITSEAISYALRYTPEEMMEQIRVRKEVAKFKRASSQKLLSRKASRRNVSKDAPTTPTPGSADGQADAPVPAVVAGNWVSNPIAQ
jgi:hypothetical protein